MPGVFPFWRIVLDAVVAFIASLGLLMALRQQFKVSLGEAAIMAGTAGLSVLICRSFANTPTLNNDPIPPISPNDTLSPIIAYVMLGMAAASSDLRMRRVGRGRGSPYPCWSLSSMS